MKHNIINSPGIFLWLFHDHSDYRELMSILQSAIRINKLKAKLIAKAKKSGIYENFGQKEVLHLQDIFYTNYQANSKVRDLIDKFDSWCMNFDDRDLRG